VNENYGEGGRFGQVNVGTRAINGWGAKKMEGMRPK